MKKISKKVLVVLLALVPCFQSPVMAGGASNEPDPIPVTPKPGDNNSNTIPRMRSRARNIVGELPFCYYYEGEVTIEAASSIASINAMVTRLDDNEQFTGVATGNVLNIQMSEDPGTYVLTFTLSDGSRYYGEYTLY